MDTTKIPIIIEKLLFQATFIRVGNFSYLFVPPKQEQIAIVSAINNLNNKIDALTSDLTRQIDHLKELKQRIISDAVTGKIDVREEKN